VLHFLKAVADTKPMSGGEEFDEIEQECLDRVVTSGQVGWLATPPTTLLITLLLHGSVDSVSLYVWFAWTNCAGLASLMSSRAYRRRRRLGPVRNWWPGLITMMLFGAAMGSLPLLALPPSNYPEMRALTVIFVCGAMATEILEKAVKPSWFLAFNLPLAAMSTIGLAVRWGSLMFALLAVLFFGFCLYSNRQAGKLLREAMNTGASNETLAEKLLEQIRVDSLTGLANRLGVIDAIDRSLASSRHDGGTVALIFFDLDRFKSVNDTHGHDIGDGLLRGVAQRVRPLVRDVDMVGRVGGDEFVVLLDRVDSDTAALAAAERIRSAIAGWIDVDGVNLTVTPSVGVALGGGANVTSDDLLRHADAALYRAKTRGRNRVELFDETLNRKLRHKRTFEGELREGIRTGAVTPWYQPIVDLDTGSIIGAEALARWVHPERGLLNAGAFIPLAEEVGLIDRIGDLMVLGVIAARSELAEAGVADEFRLHFNVSPRQLSRPDQFTRMSRLINRGRCEMSWFSAEITESAVLFDEQLAAEQLQSARSLGLRIQIDDFGTGYSSLAMLRRLPIDGVKIDRSFVQDVATNPADAAIVAAVIDLSRRLGLGVVAEGVETSAQVASLTSLGCHTAQGFLWSPAVPLEKLQELMSSGPQPSRIHAPAAVAAGNNPMVNTSSRIGLTP
jgi:diguanylate cyclase (GGDEF)-like protein